MATERNAVILTDIHMSEDNIEHLLDIAHRVKDMGLPVILAGDQFDSRRAQTQKLINAMEEFLLILTSNGAGVIMIPGNHDKTDYDSAKSFMDAYKYMPNVSLIKTYGLQQINGIRYHFIPYFSERGSDYKRYLLEAAKEASANKTGYDVLITHIAVNGVKNNEYSEVKNDLDANLFKAFDKVIVGHYHDEQHVKHIHYIGGTIQHDFSEIPDKTIFVLNEDLSGERIPHDAPKYVTKFFNLTTQSVDTVLESIPVGGKDLFRFRIFGPESEFKKINRGALEAAGIKVDYIRESLNASFIQENLDFAGYKGSDLDSALSDFAEENKEEVSEDSLEKLKAEISQLCQK